MMIGRCARSIADARLAPSDRERLRTSLVRAFIKEVVGRTHDALMSAQEVTARTHRALMSTKEITARTNHALISTKAIAARTNRVMTLTNPIPARTHDAMRSGKAHAARDNPESDANTSRR